ncbi:ubiquinone/menaquinone biosynthesis C-methylase UbiE [Actinokineospora baliensis]|uniref:class I SAM-dependent methyltransferase n=1 Tax=Actinokineospora baliensis TaxID=547056 RepID=UPI00195EE3E0|nr:class I SAM-dependent methyltransferase [Actinokineospora baliensis]MBM7774660.1 ubiquinone/menaquinone biosynthesis C-methylase UbiE [Actinokineospora baliensis]
MTAISDREKIETNGQGWNLRAQAHLDSSYYGLDTFKQGRSTLRGLEEEELGDVDGQSLLHLQCHIGTNTISLARKGARVTGADISATAIATARGLAEELGVDARFVLSNVYDLPEVLDDTFDRVFTGFGTLTWLPDLAGWARVVARFLKPGGTVTIVEIHPVLTLFDEVDGQLKLTRSLFENRQESREMTTSYADRLADRVAVPAHTLHSWQWTVADLVTALLGAGLRIERLREVPVDARQRLPLMVADGERSWRVPGDPLPLSVTCVARK